MTDSVCLLLLTLDYSCQGSLVVMGVKVDITIGVGVLSETEVQILLPSLHLDVKKRDLSICFIFNCEFHVGMLTV